MTTSSAHAAPTPQVLYIHDHLTSEVYRTHGEHSEASHLMRALFALIRRDAPHVVMLRLDDQVIRLTLRTVLQALPPAVLPHAHVFCMRGVAESFVNLRDLCPLAEDLQRPATSWMRSVLSTQVAWYGASAFGVLGNRR